MLIRISNIEFLRCVLADLLILNANSMCLLNKLYAYPFISIYFRMQMNVNFEKRLYHAIDFMCF